MPASVTVLVVEDDPVILRLLEVNFELEGFNVLAAHDGAEGIELARAEHPDVIISDIMMPKVSGLELVQAVKGDPDLAATPRSEEHTSELQSIMRLSYAVLCLNKKKTK